MAKFNLMMHPIMSEYSMLQRGFQNSGVDEDCIADKIYEFWSWDEHRKQQESLIAAHMFAGMARKVVAGQKQVGGSFLNDVRAIATYAPSVDAMFVDKECHTLLNEADEKLEYRARIFSLNTQDEFLEFLAQLEASVPKEVRDLAGRIYGV